MLVKVKTFLVNHNLIKTLSDAPLFLKKNFLLINNKVIVSENTLVQENSKFKILEETKYVSRGGYKISGVFADFKINVQDFECLDVGVSTGGFSDFLLQNGAKSVVGIDVGKNQTSPKLLSNCKFTLIESTNIRNVTSATFGTNKFDFICVDVSFISLRKCLQSITPLGKQNCKFLLLFKPQFELGRKWIKKGKVKENAPTSTEIELFCSFLKSDYKLKVIGVSKSIVLGKKKNNQEFFIYCHQ